MGRRKKGGRPAYKKRSKIPAAPRGRDTEDESNVPRSMVIYHGVASSNIRPLITDFKRVMMPNTAEKLVTKKRNSLKDFVSMSRLLKVTHLIAFSQTDKGLYLKISRIPHGPTLTFGIENYSLMKDVLSTQTKKMLHNKHVLFAPCLMTNLQPTEGEKHLQLCSKIFLDMFPTINPSSINTKSIKRCCLIHFDETNSTFDFRHYAIKLKPVGILKATQKLIGSKIPNLSSYKEMSDFVQKAEVKSESEAEDCSSSHIAIDRVRKGNMVKQQSTVKLYELGPRLTLKLIKIEDGMWNGAVLYHSYISKTSEEILVAQQKRASQRRVKRMRRKEQEENIKLKNEKKESHRQRCLEGVGIDASSSAKRSIDDVEAEDDAQYYKEELGEEPQKDLFVKKPRYKERHEYKKYSHKPGKK